MIPLSIGLKLLSIRKAAGNALTWATGNVAHLLFVALVATLAWGWWGHHSADECTTARKSDGLVWKQADATNHGTIRILMDGIHDQTGAVDALVKEGQRKQRAAQDALRAAQARSVKAKAHADAMRVSALHDASGGPLCRDSKAFLDAKDDL